ncbi:MAG: hypothetical protein CTY31_02275 [Hyphomicrobium sp.]|nr:MAG: hypothetical protein CTY39_01060 [Hyphomicrobium sp.]PPD01602.1 MAG: hypothetical protein CTY31_02275 [Hyphomicrobium sp.]
MNLTTRHTQALNHTGGHASLVFVGVVLLSLFYALLSQNPTLTICALIVLSIGLAILLRKGEPPVLAYIFMFQWAQSAGAIFYANTLGQNVDLISTNGSNIEFAIVLSMLGLLALVIGIRIAAGPPLTNYGEFARHQAQHIPQKRWFMLYVATTIVAFLAIAMAQRIPGLSQPLLALADLKWAGFVIFTFATFSNPKASRVLWGFIFLFEFVSSIGGFFSNFKSVFIFSLFGIVAARTKFSLSQNLSIAALFGLLLALGIVWSAIKPDYRSFVIEGEAASTEPMSYAERVEKLAKLVGDLDTEQTQEAISKLIERIIYVEYFGAAIDYVPKYVPHQNGALWLESVSRPFMPRLFFPNKAPIDDSILTSTYTGINVAGADHGTSISIGYMGESYIDFGPYGMMIAIFFLGLVLGGIYRWLMTSPRSAGIIGMGLVSSILMSASAIENSILKLGGTIVVSILVAFIIDRFVVPRITPLLLR